MQQQLFLPAADVDLSIGFSHYRDYPINNYPIACGKITAKLLLIQGFSRQQIYLSWRLNGKN